MKIGRTQIRLMSDGTIWDDGGGAFGLVPRTRWEKVIQPDEWNRIPMRTDSLLIESEGKRILVETGYGEKLSDEELASWSLTGDRLTTSLSRAGVAPEAIDIVINTHLHADHCGGNTRREDGRIVPAFPKAEYWIQRLEMADARYPNERTRNTYQADNFMPLEKEGYLKLLYGDTRVTSEVLCIATPGHTRGHQSVLIESDGQKALFLGDVSTLAIGMERIAWVTAYDLDPMQNIETKRRLGRWAIEEEILLIFMHDPHLRAGYLREKNGWWGLEPVDL
jgi:glyoxylase-like metal-dependent hydrolase (beta-lactamase superfamily II)